MGRAGPPIVLVNRLHAIMNTATEGMVKDELSQYVLKIVSY